jgi:hypothetical protein
LGAVPEDGGHPVRGGDRSIYSARRHV